MKLIDPVSGSVVETTDPRTIVDLRYGKGYWPVETPEPRQKKTGKTENGENIQAGPVPG
ncbi:MAG TPA: hypothetical protein VFX53_17115 [Pedococcus sp.]|nr:hypothetical protein [Pedococcus sp.]